MKMGPLHGYPCPGFAGLVVHLLMVSGREESSMCQLHSWQRMITPITPGTV